MRMVKTRKIVPDLSVVTIHIEGTHVHLRVGVLG